jgi:hypothetical protein
MRKTVIQFLFPLVVACCATTAFAAQGYPPYTCPTPPTPPVTCDTISIVNIQNAAAVPHPVPADTAFGVRGIITAFQHVAGTGFYVQIRDGGSNPLPWTGINAFRGSSSPTLVLGDSVALYGLVAEFPSTNGKTEISSNSAIVPYVRVVTSGNSLPGFHVGTVPELKELQHGGAAEQWEDMLVKVRTAMKVVRSGPPGIFSGQFKAIVNGCVAGCDSVLIDGGLLSLSSTTPTPVPPPPVGTVVDSVQGIFTESATGYQISLRGAGDLFAALAPSLIDAIPIEDNTLRVVFDRPVTQTTAEDFNNNYSLLTGTVTAASQPVPNGNVVNLTISGFPADGAAQSLTSEGIESVSSGLVSTAQTKNFFQGVETVASIQQPLTGTGGLGGTPCEDRSRFAGTGSFIGDRVSFRGVVTGINGDLNYVEDAVGGVRSGVLVFRPTATTVVGHKYLFSAGVQEFFGATEVAQTGTSPSYYVVDEGVAALPTARGPIGSSQSNFIEILRDSTCDATQSILTGEDFESVLINVPYGVVVNNRASGDNFRITNAYASDDTILVDNDFGYTFQADSLEAVSVTGLLRWNFGEFRVIPRSDADIRSLGNVTGVPGTDLPKTLSFAVTPNPGTNSNVSFGLPQRANVDLAIYDLQGRQLAVLARGELPAGAYIRRWDGKTSSGAQLGSGVYFYRLKVGDEVRMIRAVRLSR